MSRRTPFFSGDPPRRRVAPGNSGDDRSGSGKAYRSAAVRRNRRRLSEHRRSWHSPWRRQFRPRGRSPGRHAERTQVLADPPQSPLQPNRMTVTAAAILTLAATLQALSELFQGWRYTAGCGAELCGQGCGRRRHGCPCVEPAAGGLRASTIGPAGGSGLLGIRLRVGSEFPAPLPEGGALRDGVKSRRSWRPAGRMTRRCSEGWLCQRSAEASDSTHYRRVSVRRGHVLVRSRNLGCAALCQIPLVSGEVSSSV